MDARAYERYVGRWSRLFVPAILQAAQIKPGDRVLDVATGSGEAAVLAVPAVGESGLVVGADIAPAMLRPARSRLTVPAFQPVVADGQVLPFPDGIFDAVICQLGLQFFPDPGQGLAEFRRVLRKGGWAAACVVSAPERAPMWGVLADAVSRYLPGQRDQLHLSFALADPEKLERIFVSAGFQAVRVQREIREDETDSFADYWDPIEAGTGQLPQAYLALPEPSRRAVRRDVQTRLAEFESQGRLVMSVEMLIAAGQVL